MVEKVKAYWRDRLDYLKIKGLAWRAILTYNLRSNNLILKGCLSVKYCGT